MTGGMSVDELRTAVGPGGALEFTHAGGTIDVTAPLEERLRGAVLGACEFGRVTLVRASGMEAVLMSRARYVELLAAERELA